MRSIYRLCFVAFLVAGATAPRPALSQAPSQDWLIGVGAGVVSPYDYQHYTWTFVSETFGNHVTENTSSFRRTWMASFTVSRRISSAMWLQTAVDYLNQEPTGEVSVQMACSAIGVRYQFNRGGNTHPYVEFLPALFLGRWTDPLTEKSATNPKPGITGGIGLMGPLVGGFSLDVGLKGYLSDGGWPTVGHRPGETDYDGVNRWTLGGKVLYGF